MKLKGKMNPKPMVGKLRGTKSAFRQAHESAVYAEGSIELTEMKRRTPVDMRFNAPHPGALRASGRMEVERKGEVVQATFIFGDDGIVDYAVPVHEILDNFHQVGQAKYVESVLNESASSMADRIAKRVHFDTLNVVPEEE